MRQTGFPLDRDKPIPKGDQSSAQDLSNGDPEAWRVLVSTSWHLLLSPSSSSYSK